MCGVRDRGVGSWVERRARTAPDDVALTHGNTSRTYAELADRVCRLAHGLRGLGVERGDRVGWLGANHPAFLDRVENAYRSSGNLVYPAVVERVLAAHPAVADVAVALHEAAARAFVALEAGGTANEDELLDHCRTRLAAHEVPDSVVFLDRVPRSSVGKVLRHELTPADHS